MSTLLPTFINVNVNGIPALRSLGVTVTATDVRFDFNNHRNVGSPFRGLIVINLAQAVPTGTTGTLPVLFTSDGGNAQPLTTLNGDAVTAADITGTGIFLVWFENSTSTLQLLTGIVQQILTKKRFSMFQANRQGNLFYILEKGEELKLKIGQVVSVSNPQPKYGSQFSVPAFGQSEMTVDVRVKVDEETMDFKQLNANASIANSGNVVVSDSKDAMSSEVEGLLRTSKAVLDSIPYHERVLTSCDSILRELNPQFAKEKEQEEKIGALEEKMVGIEGTLGEMMNMLSSALGQSKSSKKSKEE